MKISEITEFIEQNSELGMDLEKASRAVPSLQGKALNMRANEAAILKALELELDVRKKDRWIYYSGKSDPEVYKTDPFDLRVLKGDIDMFLNADKRVTEIRTKIETQKIKVTLLEDYIKTLGQRTFLIKSCIDYMRFQAGLV